MTTAGSEGGVSVTVRGASGGAAGWRRACLFYCADCLPLKRRGWVGIAEGIFVIGDDPVFFETEIARVIAHEAANLDRGKVGDVEFADFKRFEDAAANPQRLLGLVESDLFGFAGFAQIATKRLSIHSTHES